MNLSDQVVPGAPAPVFARRGRPMLLALILVAVSSGVWFAFFGKPMGEGGNGYGTAEPDALAPSRSGGQGAGGLGTDSLVGVEFEPGDTVEGNARPANPGLPVPDLNRPIVFSATNPMPVDIQGQMRADIEAVHAALRDNPGSFGQWIQLGLLRKGVGDYEGARQAWEYASAIRPQNQLSFVNLGDLYAYYLRDITAAERNFLRAIENGPAQVFNYLKTVEFYRGVLKDTEKARAIVERGVAANPDSADFSALLQEFGTEN